MSTKERNGRLQMSFANPLSSTHKFLQACSACFLRKGTFTRRSLVWREIKMEICVHPETVSKAWFLLFLSDPGIYAFVHKPDLVHKCKKDVLLCKRKGGLQSEWTKVRPLPQMLFFNGPFVLCKGRKILTIVHSLLYLVTNVLINVKINVLQ